MLDTLDNLKAFCLPVSLQDEDGYDDLLAQIGKGVASRFDLHCNRKLSRVSGDTYETNGDSQIISLPRYPVESIAQIEFRDRYGNAWSIETEAIDSLDEESGLVTLCQPLGDYKSRIRITYTGGYWFDSVGGQSRPAGSTALTERIRLAWLTQCKHLFESLDVTGSSLSSDKYLPRLGSYDLIPDVQRALGGERRIA